MAQGNGLIPPTGDDRMDDDPLVYTSGSETISTPETTDLPRLGETGPVDRPKQQVPDLITQYPQQQNVKLAQELAEFDALERFMQKCAGEENEPVVDRHPGAPRQHLRPRAEMIVYDTEGVWCLDKGDYLLFPGGGVDDGELPLQAACRETMEEADVHPLNVQPHGSVEAVWPLDSGNEFWDNSDFDGERTYFFLCLHGGKTGFDHPDRETFKRMPFSEARRRLRELINDPDQRWAKRNNEQRLVLVREAARLVKSKVNRGPIKLADAAALKPINEYLLFTPDGKVVTRARKNRRIGLPLTGVGTPVPYGEQVPLVPEEGVPEEGVHGYAVDLLEGDTSYVPPGFEAHEPARVLEDLYAGMGNPKNRAYRALDRARARALLRRLRRKDRE